MSAGCNYSGLAVVGELTPQSSSSSMALVSAESVLQGFICAADWVLFLCGLKLATRMLVLEPFLGQVRCRSRSADMCAWFESSGWELQNDLWLVATCAGMEGSWERLCCEPRLAATFARLETLSLAPGCELMPPATCPGFVVV